MATVEASNGAANGTEAHVDEKSESQKAIDKLRMRLLTKREELEVDKMFRALVKLEGSDLHLKVGRPPMIRVRNELRPLNRGPIDEEEMINLLMPMMNDRNREIFYNEGGADFAYTCEVDGIVWRFRVNLLQQMGKMGLVARRVNNKIPDFKGLYLPPAVEQLCFYDQGMVLLAGVTGSGKARRSRRCSTTSTPASACIS